MGGLCNAVLEQSELLQSGLQTIVDWSFSNPADFSPDTLFERLLSAFGPGSQMSKMSDQILQIICGKRAETIEARRERLLEELPMKTIQAAARKIPPGVDYLFEKEGLRSLIQSLGGSQTWLKAPSYLSSKRPSSRKDFSQARSSRQLFRSDNRTTQNTKGTFSTQRNFSKVKGGAKKEFRGKSEDFSRRKSEK